MILEFSITNFLSFKDKTTMSMIGNAKNNLNDNYVVINDKKVLKSAVVYGANASGKSNLFKALLEISLMIRNSNFTDINAKLPIVPFKFDSKSNENPSEFEIKFLYHDLRYVYGFKADAKKIYEEYLYYYPNGRETRIFDRVDNRYTYDRKDTKILKKIAEMTASNKFFLATATNWNYSKTKPAYDFLTAGMCICFNLNDLKPISFNAYKQNDNNLKEFTLDFLKQTDFNIEDFDVTEVKKTQNVIHTNLNSRDYQILFKHKGQNNMLSFEEESLGTQMIFVLIPFLSITLKGCGVLIIDELDKSLHPYLVEYIVKMFNSLEYNPRGAQLIFNTHDTNLLDLNFFRRDQVWFTEKNDENGESVLYSLNDFSIRKSENIEKGYMLGRYGAVPFIKNDWNLWDNEEE